MANYSDYVTKNEDGIDVEISDAQQRQEERARDPQTGQFLPSTPQVVDWEQRYKELEKLNSRQAQVLGDYRKTIDEFIVNPTSSPGATSQEAQAPITFDDIADDPNAAISRAVENHPAILRAKELERQLNQQKIDREAEQFKSKHADYAEIGGSPEFQNWVVESPMRLELYQRADKYDFNAADALFSLYKAEKGMSQVRQEQELRQAELVSSSGEMVKEPPRFSRYEYIQNLTRAKQGDLRAEEWVKHNSAAYREALVRGEVRD